MRLWHVRPLVDLGARRRLLFGAAPDGHRPVSARGRSQAAPSRRAVGGPAPDRARAGPRACAPLGCGAVKVTRLPDVERGPARTVAVGTFDGVHLGHREVIAGSDSVLTFDPHPVSVVAPQHTPKLLTTFERKVELIESLGVQELVVIPFDAEFAQRSAQEF